MGLVLHMFRSIGFTGRMILLNLVLQTMTCSFALAQNPEHSPVEDEYVIVIDSASVQENQVSSAAKELRHSKERMWTKGLLERQSGVPIGFRIDFAPDSSVMSAEGSEQLNLIASAIELIPYTPTFEIHVSTNVRTRERTPERLALDRAYTIAAHLKANKRLKNKMILVVGRMPDKEMRTSSLSDNKHNVFFVNQGTK